MIVQPVLEPMEHYTALLIIIIVMVQVTHVENEKRILAAVSHPFIVRLVSAGLDTRFLYFVLPFIPGGELFSHLRAVRKFRKASLCIFVCVKYF